MKYLSYYYFLLFHKIIIFLSRAFTTEVPSNESFLLSVPKHLATTAYYHYNKNYGGGSMTRPKKPDGQKAIKQSVSFDPEQMERIKKYCSREERSVSWCVRKAMDQWLEDKGV